MSKKDLTLKGFEFDSDTHRYYFDGIQMTGCTTILGVLNKPMLVGWASRMACDYVKDETRKYIKDNALYLASSDFDDILEQAKNAHARKRDDSAEKGKDFHALCEIYVKECIETNKGKAIDKEVEGIEKFINWAKINNITFLKSEALFYSKSLFVAGTADLLFEKDGKRFVGDIKTMNKIWDRTPFYQCAGYSIMAEEMGEVKFDGYCVLRFGRDDKSFDEYWSFDVEGDKKGFRACAEIYRINADFKNFIKE